MGREMQDAATGRLRLESRLARRGPGQPDGSGTALTSASRAVSLVPERHHLVHFLHGRRKRIELHRLKIAAC